VLPHHQSNVGGRRMILAAALRHALRSPSAAASSKHKTPRELIAAIVAEILVDSPRKLSSHPVDEAPCAF